MKPEFLDHGYDQDNECWYWYRVRFDGVYYRVGYAGRRGAFFGQNMVSFEKMPWFKMEQTEEGRAALAWIQEDANKRDLFR